ncbi:MAG: PHP domain-containing protein [Candidatus Sigynarchaeum springense]
MARFDLHVHTEATAPYMKGDARLAPYYEHGKANRLEFMGISDHYHYVWQATRYVRAQRAHIDAAKYADPRVYLGVEQTILGNKGQIGIRGSGRDVLDYIILAIHWMSIGGRLGRETIESILQVPRNATKLVETAKAYYKGAIANSHLSRIPKIVGHPFNFLACNHAPFPELLDAVDWLCKLCADNHVAYEVNIDSVPRAGSKNAGWLDVFWQHLSASLKAHRPLVSLGSDAHRLEAIGRIDLAIACMAHYECKPDLLIGESFFDE